MGLFGDTSSFTSGKYLPSGDVKQAIQGINQNTGSKQSVTLAKADVAPMTGQTNDTPSAAPDSSTFQVDGYRNGNPNSATSEGLNARTLASNDEEEIASMTLRVSGDAAGGFGDNDIISAYTRFFLQSVSEPEQEKYQVVETFTGYYAFFYGKRPPIYRYTGVLLSDPNYRWNNDFKYMYENFFRGTSAVEFSGEVIMTYDGRVVTGFPLSLTMQQDAANDKGMPFALDMLVVDHTPVNFSIDIDGLLQQKQLELQNLRNSILATQSKIASGASPSVTTSDNVTNGILSPSSISIPGVPSGLSGISQLKVG